MNRKYINNFLIPALLDAERVKGGGDYFLSDSSFIFSIRKINPNSNKCIRVRRAVDNQEKNIGFVNDIIDHADIQSFSMGGDVFVTTFFDQKGVNDAIQTINENQPVIAKNGIVLLHNDLPKIEFSAQKQLLFNNFYQSNSEYIYFFSCISKNQNFRGNAYISNTDNNIKSYFDSFGRLRNRFVRENSINDNRGSVSTPNDTVLGRYILIRNDNFGLFVYDVPNRNAASVIYSDATIDQNIVTGNMTIGELSNNQNFNISELIGYSNIYLGNSALSNPDPDEKWIQIINNINQYFSVDYP